MARLPLAALGSLLSLQHVNVAEAFTLDGDAVFVLPYGLSSGVELALRDVQYDFYKTMGIVPVVQNGYPAAGSLPEGTTLVYFGDPSSANWLNQFDLTGCVTGWESHCVKTFASGPNGYPAIVATGTGKRGAIFGAYAFSEHVLGVNPWYHFTDDAPAYQGSIDVNASMSLTWAPPMFTHRAWFPNDEDILGGFRADPAGKSVFDLATWDKICETLLRLKGNTMLVGTNPFPDEDSVALVARRGIVVQHHHYNLCGINMLQWPLGGNDWNWNHDAGTMALGWKAAIAAQKDYEMVWSVGLRGLNDGAYNCGSPEDCGSQISAAMSNQTAWIHQMAGPNATLVLYMWQEVLDLLVGGYITLPEGVYILFTDANNGNPILNANVSKYADGLYLHTAAWPGNQLTEAIPVDRLITALGNYSKASKSTTFLVDNLSDIKPAMMTSDFVLRFLWDPTPYQSSDPVTAAKAHYASFAQAQLHVDAATASTYADIWHDFFTVPFIAGNGAPGGFISTDKALADCISNTATAAAGDIRNSGTVSRNTVNSANMCNYQAGQNQTADLVGALLQRAQALLPSIPADRQPFYTAQTILNMATIFYAAQAVNILDIAATQANSGNTAGAAAALASALAGFDAMFALRRQAEYGQWAGMYFGDHLADMQRARKAIRSFSVALASGKGKPEAPVTPSLWYDFYNYQQQWRSNWPYIKYNATVNFATYVRINCQAQNVDQGQCGNSATGGRFVKGSQASVTMMVGGGTPPGMTIRYTTDGTDPTPSSTAYNGQPLSLTSLAGPDGTAHVRAMGFNGQQPTGQITDTVWTSS